MISSRLSVDNTVAVHHRQHTGFWEATEVRWKLRLQVFCMFLIVLNCGKVWNTPPATRIGPTVVYFHGGAIQICIMSHTWEADAQPSPYCINLMFLKKDCDTILGHAKKIPKERFTNHVISAAPLHGDRFQQCHSQSQQKEHWTPTWRLAHCWTGTGWKQNCLSATAEQQWHSGSAPAPSEGTQHTICWPPPQRLWIGFG